jgi:antitoxin (DNA-binding transcriptional repressor) of toxin-antitoxin stability system
MVEELLRDGQGLQVTKRGKTVARLLPVTPATRARRPGFLARVKKIYRGKPSRVTGAELVSRERDRF